LAGPFQSFRLKIDSKTNKPHGFGFCQFSDADLAASALRNLRKVDIRGRPLKVNFAFANDNKNGNNLREEDVFYRDNGEVVKKSSTQQPQQN
jgi:cleavage stimulation factor subunit 2